MSFWETKGMQSVLSAFPESLSLYNTFHAVIKTAVSLQENIKKNSLQINTFYKLSFPQHY